jgi:hypothetical protein
MAIEKRSLARRTWRWWQAADRFGLHELVVVLAAFLLYFWIRGAVVDREADAFANARDLVSFEKSIGVYWEAEMQGWILGSSPWIRLMNWVYFWGHMPLVVVFAVWLYFRHRHTYGLVRTAFLASGAIAIVLYALYPVAPPRLLPGSGFVDTMAIYDRVGYQTQESAAFVNPFAAMPSLHFGWSMLLAAAVARVGRRWWYIAFGIAWPVAMLFAVVLTANHWIVDAVGGGVVSFAGLGVAIIIDRSVWPAVLRRWHALAEPDSDDSWQRGKPSPQAGMQLPKPDKSRFPPASKG